MADDIREKKKEIIQQSDKAIEQLNHAKEKASQGKNLFDELGIKINEDIFKLKKSRFIWASIPDEQFINPLPELESMAVSGSYLAGNMYDQSLHLKKKVNEYVEGIENFELTMGANATTTTTMLTISLDAGKIVYPFAPQIQPAIREAEAPSPLERRQELFSKLKDIQPRFAEKYDGTWKTLDDTTKPDRFRQAAHSMREVLSEFEQILAPDDLLKETEWFKKSGEGKITQRIRVKYAIIGKRDDKGIDETAIDAITKVMDDARNRYKALNKIAHARVDSENLFPLLESYLLSCEEIIIGILELRQKFFKP